MPWLCFQETPKSGLNSGPEQLCALWLAAQHSEPVFVGIKQEYYHQPHWQTVKMTSGHGNVYQGSMDRPCRAFNTLKPGPQARLPAGERKAESTRQQAPRFVPSPTRQTCRPPFLPPAEAGGYLPPTQRESSAQVTVLRPDREWLQDVPRRGDN